MEGHIGPAITQSYRNMTGFRVPDFDLLPLAAHSQFGPDIIVPWEFAEHWMSGQEYYLPSDHFLYRKRIPYNGSSFNSAAQTGQPRQVRLEEALCIALYELIERDAWTLAEISLEQPGRFPPRIDLTMRLNRSLTPLIGSSTPVGCVPIRSSRPISGFGPLAPISLIGRTQTWGFSQDLVAPLIRSKPLYARSSRLARDDAAISMGREMTLLGRSFYKLKHTDTAADLPLISTKFRSLERCRPIFQSSSQPSKRNWIGFNQSCVLAVSRTCSGNLSGTEK